VSTAEFERFAADLMSNETLRAEAEKHTAAKERVAAFAAGKGYVFTTDELTACVMAKTKTAELSDAQLAGVAGAPPRDGSIRCRSRRGW
jgi:predicted ribosomally synthesized peptide with nif11-like leader